MFVFAKVDERKKKIIYSSQVSGSRLFSAVDKFVGENKKDFFLEKKSGEAESGKTKFV